ncbi:small subunit of acetolactate synthase-domain-containing protein [Zopfochytrium polystomum]|nr:small subunit of acetolactate synthase-domain-containing protein [Zopfochytrium polystomum]
MTVAAAVVSAASAAVRAATCSSSRRAVAAPHRSFTVSAVAHTPHRHIRGRRFSLLDHPLIATPPPTAEDAVNNILYNTPPLGPSPITRHILNCLVANEPGVLSRVSGILAGRSFNIDSLVVAKTDVPDLSRMTIILRGKEATIEQARRQLEDLVPVWAVLDYTHSKIVERELLLVKVSGLPLDYHPTSAPAESSGGSAAAGAAAAAAVAAEAGAEAHHEKPTISPLLAAGIHRQAVTELARLFNARVVHVTYDNMIVELCSSPDKIDSFLKLLKPYGIVEATRSGSITLSKSPVDGLHESAAEVKDEGGAIDVTQLPPG